MFQTYFHSCFLPNQLWLRCVWILCVNWLAYEKFAMFWQDYFFIAPPTRSWMVRFLPNFCMYYLCSSHCYSTRLNLKKMGPLYFCPPVFLGIHRNPIFLEGVFSDNPIYSLLSTWISTWTEPEKMLDKVSKWHFLSFSNKDLRPIFF
jgi:hypothetical protein